MNQIPSEGEYCGKCPLLGEKITWVNRKCNRFPQQEVTNFGKGFERCLQCITDKSQTLTEKEREALINDFLHKQLKELENESSR